MPPGPDVAEGAPQAPLSGLNDRYLDLVARTAADEHASAEITGLTEQAAAAAQVFGGSLYQATMAATGARLSRYPSWLTVPGRLAPLLPQPSPKATLAATQAAGRAQNGRVVCTEAASADSSAASHTESANSAWPAHCQPGGRP